MCHASACGPVLGYLPWFPFVALRSTWITLRQGGG
jgi:hypothetical protein